MIRSILNAEHYTWGDHCDGWHLLQSDSLSVIQERMPPGRAEQLHLHHHAQQLFYILAGIATFELNGIELELKTGECLHVSPGDRHFIANRQQEELSFLVISEPKAHGDRRNL